MSLYDRLAFRADIDAEAHGPTDTAALPDRIAIGAQQGVRLLRCQAGYAMAARYERRMARVVVKLNTEVQISFPACLGEGLAGAAPEDLALIEISPSGLGLHWPRLDADLYVPGLMAGQLGSKRWMTAQFGAAGSSAPSIHLA